MHISPSGVLLKLLRKSDSYRSSPLSGYTFNSPITTSSYVKKNTTDRPSVNLRMQLKAILAWSLTFASVSALPAEQCDAARLLSTISAINGSVQALQTYVDAYNGLYNQTTTLVSAFECLKTNIEKATSDTTSSLPFSLSESNIIADHLDDLTSWVVKCVVDLVGKVCFSCLFI